MTIVAQAASYFSMLLLSTNRFVCVFMPFRYIDLFTNKTTFVYICIFTTICLAYGCVYFEGDSVTISDASHRSVLLRLTTFIITVSASCYFIFDRASLEFTFSSSHCGQILSKYMDFWFSISLFTVIYCLDISTLIKLRLVSLRSPNNTELVHA